MSKLNDIVGFLDAELNIAGIPDYEGSHNGLQLQNSGGVKKVVAAVDASLPVIRKAIEADADLLIVHHGLFWHGVQSLVGHQYDKFAESIHSELAVYSAHIPLDVHPVMGNNVLLADAIGMNHAQPYHPWKGILLGLKQNLECDLNELVKRVELAVNGPVHVCSGRNEQNVGTVGVITGGAGAEIAAMAAQGIDTFITGEGPHWSYPLAEELGVNLVYAGHYQTETFGVKKLVELVSQRWGLESEFIDHPTGL